MILLHRKALALACLCLLAPELALAASQSAEVAAPEGQVLLILRLAPEHFRPSSSYGGGYGNALSRSARRHIAQRIARQHALKLVSDWPMPLLEVDCFVMSIPAGQTAATVAAELSRDPAVAWSQPLQTFSTQGDARPRGDPLFATQPAAREWRLADLHRVATGRGVTVAVIDSMIDRDHPDLAGQVVINEDFVPDHPAPPERHGTAVAGIIAAKGDNGIGIIGVAPEARLMGLRACWQVNPDSTICNSLTLAKALHFAIEHKAQVINLSLSGPPDLLLERLLQVGLARGAAIVAAYDDTQSDGGFPAAVDGVIAVSEKPVVERRANVYYAPGRDIPTTVPGGQWYPVSGSSYSAAHVSGLVALLRQRQPHPVGPLKLVPASTGGGAIDAWATLAQTGKPGERTSIASVPASGQLQ